MWMGTLMLAVESTSGQIVWIQISSTRYYLIKIHCLGLGFFVLFVQNFIVLKLIYTKMFNLIYLFVLNGIFFVIVL